MPDYVFLTTRLATVPPSSVPPDQDYISIASVNGWQITTMGFGGTPYIVLATDTAPNGWGVAFAMAADNLLQTTVSAPSVLGADGHISIIGQLVFNVRNGTTTLPDTGGGAGTGYDLDPGFSYSADEGEYEFTGKDEADFPPDIFGTFIDDVGGNHLVGRTIEEWHWNFGDGTTQISTTPVVEHEYEDDGIFTVTVSMRDQYNLPTIAYNQQIEVETGKQVGLIDMPGNVLYSAVNSGSNVQVYQIADGI